MDALDGPRAENVTKDQQAYVRGLKDTGQGLAARRHHLEDKASRTKNAQKARRLRRRAEALAREESSVRQESDSATESGRYPLGPHAQQALLYRQRYRATVRGALEGSSWDAALSALPKPTRSAIIDVVQHGSAKDKKTLYSLLPKDQRAVLGFALGVDPHRVPKQHTLLEFFRHHALPDEDWAGWRADASLDLLKARDVVRTRQDPSDFGIFPNTVDEALSGAPEAGISLPERGRRRLQDVGDLRMKIHSLLSGRGLTGIEVGVTDEEGARGGHEAEVDVDVSQRREHAFMDAFRTQSFYSHAVCAPARAQMGGLAPGRGKNHEKMFTSARKGRFRGRNGTETGRKGHGNGTGMCAPDPGRRRAKRHPRVPPAGQKAPPPVPPSGPGGYTDRAPVVVLKVIVLTVVVLKVVVLTVIVKATGLRQAQASGTRGVRGSRCRATGKSHAGAHGGSSEAGAHGASWRRCGRWDGTAVGRSCGGRCPGRSRSACL